MRFRKISPEELSELTGLEAVKAKVYIGDLAEALGLSLGAVKKWIKVPSERVIEISALTGIEPHVLRPDIYEGYIKN